VERPGGLGAIGGTPAVRLDREDGIWSGPSTGANIAAALILARRLGEGARVATIQVDSGLKYLAGELSS
jgi:cysteine synthase A